MITRKKHRGFTLLELLIVVALVATIGSIAIPDFSTGDSYRLESSTRELAQAIRFAREEAIHTKTPHGVEYSSAENLFKVYRLDSSGGTPTRVYDIYHPITKSIYTLDFSATGEHAPVSVNTATLRFGGNTTDRDAVHFDEYGVPRYYLSGNYPLLDSANFLLIDGTNSSTVSISPLVGRVTIFQ